MPRYSVGCKPRPEARWPGSHTRSSSNKRHVSNKIIVENAAGEKVNKGAKTFLRYIGLKWFFVNHVIIFIVIIIMAVAKGLWGTVRNDKDIW